MRRPFVLVLLVGILHSCLANLPTDNSDQSAKLPFQHRPSFARLTFDVPLNFSSVYGKLEPVGSDWFILFELDKEVFPATYPAINEEIQAGDFIPKCRRFEAVREIEIELELHSAFVRLRAGNSERYEFLESINLGHEFSVNFFVQELVDGPLCSISVQAEQLEISRFSLPPSTTAHPSLAQTVGLDLEQKVPSRRMLPNVGTVTQSSRSFSEKMRFATYKMQKSTKAPKNGHSYIDIQQDRETFQSVQRSRTKEINSVWSTTFLIFLSIEVLIISSFITFGLVIFVVLQIRPKTNKHIEIVY
ncbi:hypothetical protein M3Y97_00544000 [Aphelenchoides bicaudatus]|nr:hypothetical protein M3Y97_00544000 [Aphelenchoides bicaudatus]